jgi:hypothetical protein
MKTLPIILRKNGFVYVQVLRGNRSCIYEQRVTESVSYFEVFLLKIQPARKIGNKFLEPREIFPHNEAFGYWAWSFRKFEKALQKFNEIEKGGQP